MGLRTHLRTAATIVATTVVAALLTAPSATARPCLDCEDPELPGPGGGPSCPTIAATTDPGVPTPVGSGTPLKVGVEVSATTGTWNSNTQSIAVIWYAGNAPASTSISYASAASRTVSYTAQPADVGKKLRLYVRGIGTDPTCVKGEYSESTAASVGLGDAPVATVLPSLSGELKVGSTLTAIPGTWSPTAASYAFAWAWEDGTPRGAGSTYSPTADDLGKRLRLSITAERPGHVSGTYALTTAPVVAADLAAAPIWSGKTVKLKGKDRVKKKFKVALSAAQLRQGAAAPDAAISYQWLRNGTVVKKSTGKAHKILKRDRKKKLSVRITLVRPGHHPLVLTTKAVKVKDNGRRIG